MLLGWSREQLAHSAKTNVYNVSTFERGLVQASRFHPAGEVETSIRSAFELAGVVFTEVNPPALRLRLHIRV
jgi:hypothetical protein